MDATPTGPFYAIKSQLKARTDSLRTWGSPSWCTGSGPARPAASSPCCRRTWSCRALSGTACWWLWGQLVWSNWFYIYIIEYLVCSTLNRFSSFLKQEIVKIINRIVPRREERSTAETPELVTRYLYYISLFNETGQAWSCKHLTVRRERKG